MYVDLRTAIYLQFTIASLCCNVISKRVVDISVEKLAGNGAKMVIISNSSRRSSVTMEKLKSLGFDTSCFLGAITSGELTHQYLQK
jgi:hypothetical protein